jgi:hypothetical protein
MSRRFADDADADADDEWQDEWRDEWRDEGDLDVEDPDQDEPTIPCPYCRRAIHEDSSRCPYCEQYVSREDAPRGPKPWWLVVGVILCLYALLRWLTWPAP